MTARCVLVVMPKDLELCLLSIVQPCCNPLRETPPDTCHQAVPIEDRSRAESDNHEALSNPEGTALF